jgi:hypothetical protein
MKVNIGAPDLEWSNGKMTDYTPGGGLMQEEFLRIKSQMQSFYRSVKNNAAWK